MFDFNIRWAKGKSCYVSLHIIVMKFYKPRTCKVFVLGFRSSGCLFNVWRAQSSSLRWSWLRYAKCWQSKVKGWAFGHTLDRWKMREKRNSSKTVKEESPAVQLLSKFSLSFASPFLDSKSHPWCWFLKDFYSLFTLEPLHNFNSGTFRLLKSCLVNSLPSRSLLTRLGRALSFTSPIPAEKVAFSCALNALTAFNGRNYPSTSRVLTFRKVRHLFWLMAQSSNVGLNSMVEREDYGCIDMEFRFNAVYFKGF